MLLFSQLTIKQKVDKNMTASAHIERQVDTAENVDVEFDIDEPDILWNVKRRLSTDHVPWAMVLPSQGVINVFRTNYIYNLAKEGGAEAMAKGLQYLGFFTESAPPMDVPSELITQVEDTDPQYYVTTVADPEPRTVHHLMK